MEDFARIENISKSFAGLKALKNVSFTIKKGEAIGLCGANGSNNTVAIMGFDCNKFALRYVLNGQWNFDGQCSPFQADIINGYILKLEVGQSLGLPSKIVVNPETYFANPGKITQADIDQYGIGD